MSPAKKLNRENLISDEASHPANPFMPTGVVVEFFSRVPMKSLLQFRCVSKSWLALLSSFEFIKFHLNLSANNNTNPKVVEESNLDYLMENSSISFLIKGSVKGLICLVNREKELFLWNPSIRNHKKLSYYRIESRNAIRFRYNFGYDKIHGDYKVVRIFNNNRFLNNFHEVTIYSLKNNSWRRINCPRNEAQFISRDKYVNGKFYWAITVSLDLERVWSITSFDLTDEK